MQAVFWGNLVSGMKLLGVFEDARAPIIAHKLDCLAASDTDCVSLLLPLKAPSAAHLYVNIEPPQLVILLSGSVTRGLQGVGPYPDRQTALSQAVALTFGNPNQNFYAVELAPDLADLRQQLQ